jgi:hypothetical protein
MAQELLLPSLERVRQSVQIPDGASQGQIVPWGRDRHGYNSFSPDLSHRARLYVPLPTDIERAVDLADAVTKDSDSDINIAVKQTITNPAWVREHHLRILGEARLVSRWYYRAADVGILEPDSFDPQLVLRQTVAEHLVSRAIVPPLLNGSSKAEPATYYNPFQIAALRTEFSSDHITDAQFWQAIGCTARRKTWARSFLAAVYDNPGHPPARKSYTAFRELVIMGESAVV